MHLLQPSLDNRTHYNTDICLELNTLFRTHLIITNNYIFTEDDHYIYIHINSCGGFIKDLLSNLDLFDNSIKLISIIENNISNLFKHEQEYFADCARRGIDP
mgnify:CR=1 FL=1